MDYINQDINIPPELVSFSIVCSDGYLGNIPCDMNRKNVSVDHYALLPALDNNIFYVNSINVTLKPSFANNNYNNIKSVSLQINAKGIVAMQGHFKVDISGNKNDEIVNVNFVDTKTPLFEISNLTIKKQFVLAFIVSGKDSYDTPFAYRVFYKFTYLPYTRHGDVNGDGIIDIQDVVTLANYITTDSSVPYIGGANKERSGTADVIDLINISNMVLNG